MVHNRKHGHSDGPAGPWIFLRDGKKTVLASSLLLVMAVMWIRVLVGHKPGSAAAAVDGKQASAAVEKEPAGARITMVPLPRIPGRNDVIDRDCFSMGDRAPFRQFAAAPETSTDTEVPSETDNHDQEVIQQVAQTLKLEAVVRSDGPPGLL